MVAFDAGPTLGVRTGVGRYANEVAAALDLLGVEVKRYAVALRGGSSEGLARWRVPARLAQWSWRRVHKPAIGRLTGDVDVVHGTNFVLPELGAVPGVVTVHDLSFLRDDTFPGGTRLRSLVPWSVQRAARVIVPSSAVRDEVVAAYEAPEEKVVVVPEGVSAAFFGATRLSDRALAGFGLRPPFAVAVATIEPRKNLHRLVQAWRAASLAGWTLVVAGPKGWGRKLPATPGVVLLGWVGDETLPGLLAAAEFFCYVSTYEGFGLPPLEAMAAGVPALVGRYSAADEVVGEAALLVDPVDVDAIGEGLTRLAGDERLRRRLAMSGKARAASYSWERAARSTIDVYRAAMGPVGRTPTSS
jgi:glycosyltransferase involved in cell wall biosynthesis